MSIGFQRTLYSDIINTLFDSTLAFQSTFSLITRKIVGRLTIIFLFDFDIFCFALSKQMRHAIQLQAIQALNKGLNIEHTVSSLDICKTNTLFEAYTVIRITLLAQLYELKLLLHSSWSYWALFGPTETQKSLEIFESSLWTLLIHKDYFHASKAIPSSLHFEQNDLLIQKFVFSNRHERTNERTNELSDMVTPSAADRSQKFNLKKTSNNFVHI